RLGVEGKEKRKFEINPYWKENRKWFLEQPEQLPLTNHAMRSALLFEKKQEESKKNMKMRRENGWMTEFKLSQKVDYETNVVFVAVGRCIFFCGLLTSKGHKHSVYITENGVWVSGQNEYGMEIF